MCLPIQLNLVNSSTELSSSVRNVKRSFPSSVSDLTTYTVPTFREKPSESIELSCMSSSDIDSLKEVDPFMYYSIPAVRKSAMKGQEVDASILCRTASSTSSRHDMKYGPRKSRRVSSTVKKQSRLSMEMHPDALTAEMLNDAEIMSKISTSGLEEDDDCFEDLLFSLFETATKRYN